MLVASPPTRAKNRPPVLVGESGMDGPVFAKRDGGWMSLANLRRSLRDALPERPRPDHSREFQANGGNNDP